MTARAPHPGNARSEHSTLAARKGFYRAGFLLSCAMVVATVVLLPVAFSSLFTSLRQGGVGTSYDVWKPSSLTGEWTKLSISANSLDEPDREISFDVTGFHNCPKGCTQTERVEFFSVDSDPTGALGAPPSVSVDLPPDSSEVDELITLPVTGNLTQYPFDSYHITLGVAFSLVGSSGSTTSVHPLSAKHDLAFSIDNTIPRTVMAAPGVLALSEYQTTGVDYDAVLSLTFSRPAYLWSVTVLLLLLIIFAEAYGVFLRPFTQLIPTIGGIVLGVWGVRSLLVGSYPPDSTGVDLVLEGLILLLLLSVAIRAAVFMRQQSMGVVAVPAGEESEEEPEQPDTPEIEEHGKGG